MRVTGQLRAGRRSEFIGRRSARRQSLREQFVVHFRIGKRLPDLGTQSRAVHTRIGSPTGPISLDSRYFTEDVPYGLAFYAAMGRVVRVPTPCIDACIALASAACGRDFASENAMISTLGLDRVSATELSALARDGYCLP